MQFFDLGREVRNHVWELVALPPTEIPGLQGFVSAKQRTDPPSSNVLGNILQLGLPLETRFEDFIHFCRHFQTFLGNWHTGVFEICI